MEYNNKLSPITLPEYGRHIQKLVQYCMSIEDRAKRNVCAKKIIRTMTGLSPERRECPDSNLVYWDHLAIISGFQLDVDYPEGTITADRLQETPPPPPYISHRIKYRYYGHIIEGMIGRVCQMEQGKDRAMLEYFIATQMKRAYMTWNSDTVDDLQIFKDLFELSEGEIMLTPENCKLVINPNSIDRGGKQKVSKKQLKQRSK